MLLIAGKLRDENVRSRNHMVNLSAIEGHPPQAMYTVPSLEYTTMSEDTVDTWTFCGVISGVEVFVEQLSASDSLKYDYNTQTTS